MIEMAQFHRGDPERSRRGVAGIYGAYYRAGDKTPRCPACEKPLAEGADGCEHCNWTNGVDGPGQPNPEWWEAAIAGRCSHGGHGWDGETCSDAPATLADVTELGPAYYDPPEAETGPEDWPDAGSGAEDDELRTRQAAQVLAGLVALGFTPDEIERAVDRAEVELPHREVAGFGACESRVYPPLGAEEHLEAGWA